VLLINTVYGSRADYAPEFGGFLLDLISLDKFAAAVFFDLWEIRDIPALAHLDSSTPRTESSDSLKVYSYPEAPSSWFIIPGHADFNYSSAGVAHTRTLTFIKTHLGGPYFDLEKIWDEHTYYEFGNRSVEKTMATMVQEPYVNHVPTVS
jgi:carboxymethylenebutenolidase